MAVDPEKALLEGWHAARKREYAAAEAYNRKPSQANLRAWGRAEKATGRAYRDYLVAAGQPDVARALEELFGGKREVAR